MKMLKLGALLAAVLFLCLASYLLGKHRAGADVFPSGYPDKSSLGFMLQTLDFMLEASQLSPDAQDERKSQLINMQIADTAFFLSRSLASGDAQAALQPGLCRLYPRFDFYVQQVRGGAISVDALGEDYVKYFKESILNASVDFRGACGVG